MDASVYQKEMKDHEFVLWVIGAHAEDKGKFVYELPENVVEVKEVFLDDALHVKDTEETSTYIYQGRTRQPS